MNIPPGYRGRIPEAWLRRAREPRLVGRLRAARLYAAWWLGDVADDLRLLTQESRARRLPAEDLGCLVCLVAAGLLGLLAGALVLWALGGIG